MSGRNSNRSRRASAEPEDAPGFSMAKIVLVGGLALLVGIGAMLAFRFKQVDDAAEMVEGGEVAAGDGTDTSATDGDKIPDDTEVHVKPVADSEDKSTSETAAVDTGSDSSADDGIPNELDSDRGRKLMASMSTVAIRISEFPQDSRGAVAASVQSGMKDQLDKCRLTFRAGDNEPVMQILLDVRGSGDSAMLWMSAELLAKDTQVVKVWARSGSVAPITEQALDSGIVPPNLDRDVANFFRSLRGDFVDARRQFGS